MKNTETKLLLSVDYVESGYRPKIVLTSLRSTNSQTNIVPKKEKTVCNSQLSYIITIHVSYITLLFIAVTIALK